jgi:hypothetical protein
MMIYEIFEKFRVRKLDMHEQVLSFDCGDEDLNDFIRHESALYRKELLAVSYVFIERNTQKVAAYFSLANDRISISDFPNNTAFNRFRKQKFVNEKRLKSYPATKVCRLAVDIEFQRFSLGSCILDFIKTYFTDDNKTGCRFLTVDAYVNAIPFYKKNEFVALDDLDNNKHTRLYYYDLSKVMPRQ